MKKVVLAFDSFKGCISAREACEACAQGVCEAWQDAVIVQIPLSDGGEGLVECVRRMLPTRSVTVEVHGPLMDRVEAEYAISADGKTAYMEMAAASGLTLVPQEQRNPMTATTYGVGEMIADAVKRGCQTIVMGIGGSATCDGGRGMIEALGDCRCLDMDCRVIVACDVNNPLFGKNGAAYVFAPQKGATPEQVELLDGRLRAFAKETEQTGRATPELALSPGAGAAGGLGYALLAYLNAELQTLMGKVPHGVLKRCQEANVPVWLLSGMVDDATGRLAENFDVVRSINEGETRPLSVLMQPNVAKQNLKESVSFLVTNYHELSMN